MDYKKTIADLKAKIAETKTEEKFYNEFCQTYPQPEKIFKTSMNKKIVGEYWITYKAADLAAAEAIAAGFDCLDIFKHSDSCTSFNPEPGEDNCGKALYEVNRFSEQYQHEERFIFWAEVCGHVCKLIVELEKRAVKYELEKKSNHWDAKITGSRIIQDVKNPLPFNDKIQWWSSNHIHNFTLYRYTR